MLVNLNRGSIVLIASGQRFFAWGNKIEDLGDGNGKLLT